MEPFPAQQYGLILSIYYLLDPSGQFYGVTARSKWSKSNGNDAVGPRRRYTIKCVLAATETKKRIPR